jgi:MFS family permease
MNVLKQLTRAVLDRFGATFRSLKYRNYRLFFFGQGLSLIGTWMQQIAVAWLVYRLSGSSVALGVVAFAGQIPVFLLAPVGGLVADRYGRHRTLLVTQVLSMLEAAVLAWLVVSGQIQVWHLFLLNAILGSINAFDMPTRHAFVIEMIDRQEDLGNAIALNSSMFNGARLIGPTIAGVVISLYGESLCFVLNATSYIAVIVSLLLMRFTRVRVPAEKVHPARQLVSGFQYVWQFKPITHLVGFMAMVSLTGMSYMVLLPVFAGMFRQGSSETYGIMMGACGVGAVSGALYMAGRKTVLGLGKKLAAAGILFGLALIGFALSPYLLLSLALLVVAGFGMMVLMASCNTLLQTMVDDEKRGMVMSIYMMSFIGVAPLGNLMAGFLAHHIGANVTVLIGGVICILNAGLFASRLPVLRKMVHPIYVKKGILPQVAMGLETAVTLASPPED